MLEILQFVFSSFWIWLGTVILVAIAGSSLSIIRFSLFARHKHGKKKHKKSRSYTYGPTEINPNAVNELPPLPKG